MRTPAWISADEALGIHDLMLAQYGGLAGLRDAGLFESALHRPMQLLNYGKPTLPKLAAVYAAGIVKNHPFVDGNKRTGFMLAAVFLEANGLVLTASEESAVLHTLRLANRKESDAAYARWLAENTHRRRRASATPQ